MAIDIKELARIGAEAKIKELQAQIDEIRKFPRLRVQSDRPTAGTAPVMAGTARAVCPMPL